MFKTIFALSEFKEEKWGKDVDVEQPGEWKGYTLEELKKKRNAARKRQQSRDTADPKDTELLRELNFAIRAKTGWGKAASNNKIAQPQQQNVPPGGFGQKGPDLSQTGGGISPEDINAQSLIWRQIKALLNQMKQNPQQFVQYVPQLEKSLSDFELKMTGIQGQISRPNMPPVNLFKEDTVLKQVKMLLNQMKQNPQQFPQYIQTIENLLRNIETTLLKNKMIK